MRGSGGSHAAHQQANGMNKVDYFDFQSLARHGEFILHGKQVNWQGKLASMAVYLGRQKAAALNPEGSCRVVADTTCLALDGRVAWLCAEVPSYFAILVWSASCFLLAVTFPRFIVHFPGNEEL